MSQVSKVRRSDQVRNRAALLKAGRQVFAARGIDAPFELVGTTAGLSQATLYRHFPKREDLLVEIFRECLEEHFTKFDELAETADPWQAILDYVSWVFEAHYTDLCITRPLSMIISGYDEELDKRRVQAGVTLTRIIDRAKAQGKFRPDRWLDDLLLFFSTNERIARYGDEARGISARLLELLIDSIAMDRRVDMNATVPKNPSIVTLRGREAVRQ